MWRHNYKSSIGSIANLSHRMYIPNGYYNLMNHEVPRHEGWGLGDVTF